MVVAEHFLVRSECHFGTVFLVCVDDFGFSHEFTFGILDVFCLSVAIRLSDEM